MENKCFIEALSSSVQNDNLKRFGVIDIELVATNTVLVLDVDGCSKMVVDGSGYFTDATGEQNYGQTRENVESNRWRLKNITNGDILHVYGKYNFTLFSVNDSITAFAPNKLIDFSWCTKLEQINLGNSNEPLISLDDLTQTVSSLTRLRSPYNTNLSGNIETIAENMVSKGRTTGTFVIGGAYTTGVLLNESNVFASRSWICISFESVSSVKVYEGQDTTGTQIASWNGSIWNYD